MEFIPFPKIPRLSRECVITEMIDGVNASVWIEPWGFENNERKSSAYWHPRHVEDVACVKLNDLDFTIRAASRSRFITPDNDNFGFAAWVRDNAEELVKLGPGVHYGEWWGQGIQRGYGLDERRFSLFNTGRWIDTHDEMGPEINALIDEFKLERAPACCHVVPVLWRGPFGEMHLNWDGERYGIMPELKRTGSHAAPGFMNPEGITIYHTAAQQYFKKTFENDGGKNG